MIEAILAGMLAISPSGDACEGGDPDLAPAIFADLAAALNGGDAALAEFARRYGWDDDPTLSLTQAALGGEIAIVDYLWCWDDSVGARVNGASDRTGLTLFIDTRPGDPPDLLAVGLRRRAPDSPPGLPQETVRDVSADIAARLRTGYILPDIGAEMAQALAGQTAAGRYDQLSSPDAFALRVTQDLRRIYPDQHLQIYAPEAFAQRQAMLDGHDGAGHDRAEEQPTLRPIEYGDQRYALLTIPGFIADTPAYHAALAGFLPDMAAADGIIIDIRQSPGGDGGVLSRLLDQMFPVPTIVGGTELRDPGTGERVTAISRTAPDPARPVMDSPLIVLVSRATGSAAESFAFSVQMTGRGRLVGERTAGAGHRITLVGLPGGFGMNLPIGRGFNPETGEGWDVRGLTPDIAISPDQALPAAISALSGETVTAMPHPAEG